MRRIHVLLLVVALLVMNIATVAHAGCSDIVPCSDEQVMHAADNGSGESSDQAACDCLTCHHQHHAQAFLSYTKVETYALDAENRFSWDGESYLSQLHYPPSKPPKA